MERYGTSHEGKRGEIPGSGKMKEVRPTSGKVLAALFNILGNMAGKSFLDLFAGTGRVALEAESQGASCVYAVECIRSRCHEIKGAFSGKEELHLLCRDVRRALPWLVGRGLSFDVIFADPPYHQGWPRELLTLLHKRQEVVRPGGIIVIEHTVREALPDGSEGFELYDVRRYGDTGLAFYHGAEKTEDVSP